MKVHTTNYVNTFIEIAEDSKNQSAVKPEPKAGKPTIASMQFEMLYGHPYKYSSDDVLFTVFADRQEIPESEREEARQIFFSKGQACFRASPLTKQFGWGVHCNAEGKIALCPAGSTEYQQWLTDANTARVKAMKSGS